MGLKNSVTTKFSDLGKIVLSEKRSKTGTQDPIFHYLCKPISKHMSVITGINSIQQFFHKKKAITIS